MQKRTFKLYFQNRMKSGKSFPLVLSIFLIFCFSSFVYFTVIGQVRNCLMCLLFTLFVPLMLFLENKLKVKFVTLFSAIVLFIPTGSILGACYNLYTIIPWFDILLHGLSGFIFACLGFMLMELMIGESQDKKKFFACLLFGVMFSLAIAVLWELYEHAAGALLGSDMQEDKIISGFGSYLLSGNHNEVFEVDGITKTIIYYGNGKTLAIDGYLDIGLFDTIGDMAVCTLGALIYTLALVVDWFKCKKRLYRLVVPQLDRIPPEIKQEEFQLA